MANPLQPFWDDLASIESEIQAALEDRKQEIEKLCRAIEASLALARELERDDLIHRLEALRRPLIPKDPGPAAKDDEIEAAPEVEPEPAAVPKPEPHAGPEEAEEDSKLRLPKVTPAKKRQAKGQTKQFLARQAAFFALESIVLEAGMRDVQRQFQIRRLICEARGLIVWAGDLEEPDNAISQSLQHLQREQHGEFFGLNRSRNHKPDQWFELAEAYGFLADADAALQWEGLSELGTDDLKDVIDALAAANVFLARLNFDHGYGFTDKDQMEQRKAIEHRNPKNHFIRWWGFNDNPPAMSAIVKRAKEAAPLVERLRARRAKTATREQAKEAMTRLIDEIAGDSAPIDFVETLRQHVRDCLSSGVRPSNKDFVTLLLPYRHLLRDLGVPNDSQFETYLQREDNRQVARNQVQEDVDAPEESQETKEALRAFLEGKKVLMIGGRSDRQKVKALRDALRCEVEWPDSTDSTKIESFRAAVERADIVCRFIRWSRHSYKEPLDWAEAQGKPTVSFKAGSGVNRVIHDMTFQLRVS